MSAVPGSAISWPSRLVDAHHAGWYRVSAGRYATPPKPDTWDYARISAQRGPVREVIAPDELDVLLVQTALEHAGQLAVGSLAVALHQVMTEHGTVGPLVAGDPQSWESAVLAEIATDTGARLRAQAHRWDTDAVTVLAEVIRRWTDPAGPGYVEVASTLARIFAPVATSAGGWDQVSDRWMHPAWTRTPPSPGDDRAEIATLRTYLFDEAAVT